MTRCIFLFVVAILMVLLPINSLSQRDPTFRLYDVNKWDYYGCWGIQDSINTGMRIEAGLIPSDSVQRFNMYGHPIYENLEWFLQTSFGRFDLEEPEYALPEKVLIDFNVLGAVNAQDPLYIFLGLIYEDSAGGGQIKSLTEYLPVAPGWQTLEFEVGGLPMPGVNAIGIDFKILTGIDIYCGLEVQANNLRFIYNNGQDTVLVDSFGDEGPSSVEQIFDLTPTGYVLAQNYPNPFNPSTVIRYEIPEYSPITLKVYDLLGEEVATLVNEEQSTGVYEAHFDASYLASGTYIYVLQAGSYRLQNKMLLIK